MALRKAFIVTGDTPDIRRQRGEEIVRANPSMVCNSYFDTGFPDRYALIFGDDSADFSYVDGNALLFAATFREPQQPREEEPADFLSGLSFLLPKI